MADEQDRQGQTPDDRSPDAVADQAPKAPETAPAKTPPAKAAKTLCEPLKIESLAGVPAPADAPSVIVALALTKRLGRVQPDASERRTRNGRQSGLHEFGAA